MALVYKDGTDISLGWKTQYYLGEYHLRTPEGSFLNKKQQFMNPNLYLEIQYIEKQSSDIA